MSPAADKNGHGDLLRKQPNLDNLIANRKQSRIYAGLLGENFLRLLRANALWCGVLMEWC